MFHEVHVASITLCACAHRITAQQYNSFENFFPLCSLKIILKQGVLSQRRVKSEAGELVGECKTESHVNTISAGHIFSLVSDGWWEKSCHKLIIRSEVVELVKQQPSSP